MRRVMAAFDLTPVGRRVVERARLLAEQFGTHLELLHVLEQCEDPFLSEDEERFMNDHQHTAAAALVDWVAGRTSAPIDFHVTRGAPSTQVARLGREADLLVTGTSSIDAAQLGPVTRRLARKARSNVLAVRRQPRVPYRRVVAAVDLSEPSREAVELALALAPAAELTVVYALSARSDVLLGQSRLFEQDAAARSQRPFGSRSSCTRPVHLSVGGRRPQPDRRRSARQGRWGSCPKTGCRSRYRCQPGRRRHIDRAVGWDGRGDHVLGLFRRCRGAGRSGLSATVGRLSVQAFAGK